VHLPEFHSECDGKSDCTLKLVTVSEALYEKIDALDTGFSNISATEIKAKLSSR